MIRKSMAVLGVVIGGAFIAAGCDTPASNQESARKAQVEADQTRATAQTKSNKLVAESNKLLAESEVEAVDKEKAAGERRAKAEDGLSKDRTEYRTNIQKEIADLDVKVEEIRAGAPLVPPSGRDDVDRALRDVTAHRGDLMADLRKIDNVGADGWKPMKDALDKDLDAYKASVKMASSRIKSQPGRIRTEPNPKFGETVRPGEAPKVPPPVAP